MPAVENFNKVENIKENTPEWVKQKITVELNELKNKVQLDNLKTDMFYEIKEENWEKKVDYHMETVKAYLSTLNGLSINEIRDKWAAWVMAVQIALESEGYNVWKIDWMLWVATKAAVRDFQTNQWIKVDWDPGPETISKLLNVLWVDQSKDNQEKNIDGDDNKWWDPKENGDWESKEKVKDWVDRTEKFKADKFKSLRDKAKFLLPDKVSFAALSNPEFTVKIEDKYNNWNVVKYVKFNFHDYLEGDIFQEDKLAADIKEAKDEWYDERTFQDFIMHNKYSLEDLFPWRTVSLWKFFSKFRWNKLTIDNVDFSWDKVYFQFDKKWFNAAKWCDQEIDKSELKDGWRYSQDKFKDKLRDIVTKIVDENFKD